jgi:hypothetical protein
MGYRLSDLLYMFVAPDQTWQAVTAEFLEWVVAYMQDSTTS